MIEKHPNRDEVIASKTLGYRKVMNTEWPREAYIGRSYSGGKIEGYNVEVICNGTNDSYEFFKTRREAEAAFEALGPGV